MSAPFPSTSSSASTRCSGARACCSAAPSTASPIRRCRSTFGRAFATPGTEAKELFRPRGHCRMPGSARPTCRSPAQYFFGWDSVQHPGVRLLPEPGYLSIGGESFLFGGCGPRFHATGVTRLWRGTTSRRTNTGDFGLAARWSPPWLDGTLGGYYRRTYDTVPQPMATRACARAVPRRSAPRRRCRAAGRYLCLANPQRRRRAGGRAVRQASGYNAAFGDDIDIFGISLSKNIAGVSLGAEFSYRQDMPLLSDAVQVLPAALRAAVPGSIATTACRRATRRAPRRHWHGVVNVLGSSPRRPCSTPQPERRVDLDDVGRRTQNEAVFKGREQRPGYTQIDRVSKNYVGVAVNFTPTWFQVFPGRRPPRAVVLVARVSPAIPPLRRRQQGYRQLSRRHRRRHLPEVPHRPEVRRLLRRLLDDRRARRPRRRAKGVPNGAQRHRCPIAACRR